MTPATQWPPSIVIIARWKKGVNPFLKTWRVCDSPPTIALGSLRTRDAGFRYAGSTLRLLDSMTAGPAASVVPRTWVGCVRSVISPHARQGRQNKSAWLGQATDAGASGAPMDGFGRPRSAIGRSGRKSIKSLEANTGSNW